MAIKYLRASPSSDRPTHENLLASVPTGSIKAANTFVHAAQDYRVGDMVVFQGLGGMTEINGKKGTIAAVPAKTVMTIDIDTSGFTNFTSGGTMTIVPQDPADPNEIMLFYDDTVKGLTLVDAAQRALEYFITLFSVGNPMTSIAFSWPWLIQFTSKTPRGPSRFWTSQFVQQEDVLTAMTAASPAGTGTSVGHNFVSGEKIVFRDCLGQTELNPLMCTIAGGTPGVTILTNIDTGAFGAYTASSGTISRVLEAANITGEIAIYINTKDPDKDNLVIALQRAKDHLTDLVT